MALQRVETDAIQDDAVTTAKIAANAVAAADIAADAITNIKVAAGAAIAVSKITGLGTAATLTAGTAANNVVQLDGSGRLPAISGANLTGVSTDTSAIENNIAILAFKTQAANDLAKFNLVDQVIDEYKDGTGATYSTAGQGGSTAADGYLSSIYSSSSLGSLTAVGVANFTAGAGSIGGWTWGSGASSNDLSGIGGGATEQGGTTDGATTPIIFEANKPFEYHFIPVKSGSGYGGMVGIVNQSYAGNNFQEGASGGLDGIAGYMCVTAGNNNSRHGFAYVESTTRAQINTTAYSGVSCIYKRNANNYLEFWANGSLVFTSTVTHTFAIEIIISGQGGNNSNVNDQNYKKTTTTSATSAAGTATSTANTALTAPTTGDIVMLIENASGTATLNTAGNDLRCAISRNGGTGWDYVTLVDKGTWGSGTKKILVANNVAFSNSASGTDMRYKIEWANQASGTKETRVHATSLAWA
jgi:hypothetical protein